MRGRKKNYRYLIGMFLMAFLLIGMAKGVDVKAATGKCGTHVKWTYKNKILTISGKGKMKDYTDMSKTPWWAYRNKYKKIVIEKEVTKLGKNSFYTEHDYVNKKLRFVLIKNKKFEFIYPGFSGWTGKPITLIGYDNSTTETYAKESRYNFSSLSNNAGIHFTDVNNVKTKWKYASDDLRKIDKKYFGIGNINFKGSKYAFLNVEYADGLNALFYLYDWEKKDLNEDELAVNIIVRKNKLYYYRVRNYFWDRMSPSGKMSPYSDYKAFITGTYKYRFKSKSSWAVKVPDIKGIENYTVYLSTKKMSGYKKVKTVKPGKSVTISKYKGKKLKKNKNYYIKFVAKTKDGVTCDAAVYRFKTQN